MDTVQVRSEIELSGVAVYNSLVESLEKAHVGLGHVVLVLQKARRRERKLSNQITVAKISTEAGERLLGLSWLCISLPL